MVGPPGTCVFPGVPQVTATQYILDGASVTAYQATAVPAGSSCVSQTRTCSNTVLSGSYPASSCVPEPVAGGNAEGDVLSTWYTKSSSIPSIPSGKMRVTGFAVDTSPKGINSWEPIAINRALVQVMGAATGAISNCRSQGQEAVLGKPNIGKTFISADNRLTYTGTIDYTCAAGKKYWIESNNILQTTAVLRSQVGTNLPARVCLTEVPTSPQVVLLATYKEAYLGVPLSVTIPAGSKCADYNAALKYNVTTYGHAKLNGHSVAFDVTAN
jgi:hypothetical protein